MIKRRCCLGAIHVVRIFSIALRRLVEPSLFCFRLAVTEEPETDGGEEYTNANACADCDADL